MDVNKLYTINSVRQDKSDLELFYLIDYFKEASRFDDLRIYNKEKLHLEKLIDYELWLNTIWREYIRNSIAFLYLFGCEN
jgi:hypothetical protein